MSDTCSECFSCTVIVGNIQYPSHLLLIRPAVMDNLSDMHVHCCASSASMQHMKSSVQFDVFDTVCVALQRPDDEDDTLLLKPLQLFTCSILANKDTSLAVAAFRQDRSGSQHDSVCRGKLFQ